MEATLLTACVYPSSKRAYWPDPNHVMSMLQKNVQLNPNGKKGKDLVFQGSTWQMCLRIS
uniref:Uncharacterized protein n=1 Tax=Arundo donax TaxID=35708 RepID=A0A0A9CJB0_ARUDO